MLTKEHRQESLSRAYIQAVAARCGMSIASYDYDYGIDLTLMEISSKGGTFFPCGHRLDVQAKSTVVAKFDPKTIKYDLKIRNYDILRDPKVPTAVPRILVLLVLPRPEPDWMAQDEDSLAIRRCAYWTSLKGKRHRKSKSKVRIKLSRSNVFCPKSLRTIMTTVAGGEEL